MSIKYKIIISALYFAIILSTERAYYQKLFNESLDIIPKFQKSSNAYTFWKFVQYFGTKTIQGPIYIILFLFIPLNQVFVLTFLLMFTGYVDHTSKILYRQERPIWINSDIDIHSEHSCGYGNPSGHSLSSSCFYLSFWFILFELIKKKQFKDNYKKNIIIYGILLLCILIVVLIMISRLYIGVHSLNQIIFGCLIGIGIFLIFLPLFKIYYESGNEFLNKHYKYRYISLSLILAGIILFYVSYFARKNVEGVELYENWRKMCLNQKWSKLLIKSSFMGGQSIFIILGMFIGLFYTKLKIDNIYSDKEDIIINWTEEKFMTRLIRLIILVIGFIPVGIIFLLNLFDISYIFFYIATPILFFAGGFLTFGPCFLLGYKCTMKKYENNKVISLENKLSAIIYS